MNSELIYLLAADLLLVLHVLIACFVVLGLLLVLVASLQKIFPVIVLHLEYQQKYIIIDFRKK